jgi:peptidoglycan/LPS O-acetylase OafA/YrhL
MYGFFIISSYILFFSLSNENYTIDNFGRFIIKRFLRIYPPFFISVLIVLLIQYLFTLNPHFQGLPFKVVWPRLISNLLFCPTFFGYEWYNAIYWTLAIEFQFYIILGLVFPILNSSKFNNTFIYEFIAILLMYFTIYLDSTTYNLNEQTMISYLDLFYLGFTLYRYKSNKIGLNRMWVLFCLIFPGIFVHYHFGLHYMVFYVCIIFVLATLYIKKQSKIILKVSNFSYSFYLTHGFIGGLFLYFTRNIFTDDLTRSFMVILAIIISMLGALPFFWVIEKPCQKESQKLRLNPANNVPK